MSAEIIKESSCKTCGDWKRYPCNLCGTCAEDWNARDEKGTVRINRRRKRNGLEPLERT